MRADAAAVSGLPAGLLRLAPDQRLVEYVRAGSDRAFETLFDRHHRSVLSFCARMLGSQEQAEDATQETFLVAYRELARFAEPVALRPWLCGIARHRCLMTLRGRRECPVGEVAVRGRTCDLAVEVGMRDDLRAMLADVARLPNEQRAALVLVEFRDLSHEEIARILGCPREKVKALVFQARASLSAARDARETPCAEIREQLTTLRGPALGRATLRRHLNACSGCRAYRDAVHPRRGRLGARLLWAPVIALKRSVVGAVFGSGSGAGCAALTGGALGGPGLVAAALVAVAIPLGGVAAVTAPRDGDEPVRSVARVEPVTFAAGHAEQSTSPERALSREVPGAARGGGDDLRRTGPDQGATGADEQPASQDSAARDDRQADEQPAPESTAAGDDRQAGDEHVVDDGEAAPASDGGHEAVPLEPSRPEPPVSPPVPGSGDGRMPALPVKGPETSPSSAPAAPPRASGVGPDSAPRAGEHPLPATLPQAAGERQQPAPTPRSAAAPPAPPAPPDARPSETDARRGSAAVNPQSSESLTPTESR